MPLGNTENRINYRKLLLIKKNRLLESLLIALSWTAQIA